MAADPDATRARRETSSRRETGALVETPPGEGDTSSGTDAGIDASTDTDTAAIEAFFTPERTEPPAEPSTEPPSPRPTRRERRELQRTTAGEHAPASVRRRPRYQARRVHRLVRHVEPWSVLKISLIFFFCIWVILLTAAVLLWQVASSSGIIDNVENFIEEIFALEDDSFAFEAGQMFRAYAVGGLVMVVAATGFTVLLAVLFNLISDLTGGVRVTVIEEESARPVERRPTLTDGQADRRLR